LRASRRQGRLRSRRNRALRRPGDRAAQGAHARRRDRHRALQGAASDQGRRPGGADVGTAAPGGREGSGGMNLSDLLAVAVQALRVNKLRSGLTLLGVIIGVMTVVAVLSVISGLNDYVMNKIVNLNPDVLVFTKYGILRSREEFILASKRKEMTRRDL